MSELGDLKKELAAANERLANVENTLRARGDAERWADDHPEFFQCKANAARLADEIQERGLPYTYDSYNAVYADIREELEKGPTAAATTEETPKRLSKSDKEFLDWAEHLSANDFQRQVIGNRENFARYNKLTAHQAVKVGN